MDTGCVVYDLTAFRAKREFQKLSEMIGSIVSDRNSLPFKINSIKQAILNSHKVA